MIVEFGALTIIVFVFIALLWYLISFKFAKIGEKTEKATKHFNFKEGDLTNGRQRVLPDNGEKKSELH
jgi:ferric iron reductase protein FhuF